MKIALISLFPEVVEYFAHYGVTGKATAEKIVELSCFNPRDYSTDKHRTVDDRPYGGGPGMVMTCGPLKSAIEAARGWLGEDRQEPSAAANPARVIYLSPQGKRLVQARTRELAGQNLILIAGRYEGIDQRVIDALVDEEISIGDYVLSGGELPALVLIDAILRHVPGVLGHADSAEQDSFGELGLDWPHYTRPEEFEGRAVPAVLLSGDHRLIESWRQQQATIKTRRMRPDLILSRGK